MLGKIINFNLVKKRKLIFSLLKVGIILKKHYPTPWDKWEKDLVDVMVITSQMYHFPV